MFGEKADMVKVSLLTEGYDTLHKSHVIPDAMGPSKMNLYKNDTNREENFMAKEDTALFEQQKINGIAELNELYENFDNYLQHAQKNIENRGPNSKATQVEMERHDRIRKILAFIMRHIELLDNATPEKFDELLTYGLRKLLPIREKILKDQENVTACQERENCSSSTVKTIVDSKDQKRTETSRSFSSEGAFSSFCHSETSGSSIQNSIVLENVRDLREFCEDHKTHLHDKLDLKTDLDRDCSSGTVSTMTTKNNYEDNIEHPLKISSPTLSEDFTIDLYSHFTKEEAMPQQHTTKEKLVEKATADTDTKFSSIINANFANTYYHNQALKEVEYQCSSCRNVYSSKQKLNPWWALVKERCPDCGESQIPRIDISSQQNQIDCHPALLAEEGEEENEDEDLESFSIDLNYTRGDISMEDSVVSKKDNTKTVLSRTENLEDNAKKDRGDGTERIGMTGIAIHNGSLAEVEETNALNPAQAAQLLVLISHARTCSGKHESFGQREICRATKFLMLHIRDCDGKLLDGSDCCFSWCKACKNLLTHLVSCVDQDKCIVCNSKDLPSKIDELKGVNAIRTKLAVSAKQNLMETVTRNMDDKISRVEESQATGHMMTENNNTSNQNSLSPISVPALPLNKVLPFPQLIAPSIHNESPLKFDTNIPSTSFDNNQGGDGNQKSMCSMLYPEAEIENKRKRKSSISKDVKYEKKRKYNSEITQNNNDNHNNTNLPTCPIVVHGKQSFSGHFDLSNMVYNNLNNTNKNHHRISEAKAQTSINMNMYSKPLQLPSQAKNETEVKLNANAPTMNGLYSSVHIMQSNTSPIVQQTGNIVNNFNPNCMGNNSTAKGVTSDPSTTSTYSIPDFKHCQGNKILRIDSANSLYALSYSDRNDSSDTLKDLITSYCEHGGDIKQIKGQNRMTSFNSFNSLTSVGDVIV